ncbi:MAG: c-type cytochrome [Usitatibacter sp.]
MLLRAIAGLILAVGAATAHAQNVANGQALYAATCNSCHGTPPSGGPELAPNNPSLIKSAINGLVPAMSFLRGMYSDAQLADIAAYIASLRPGAPPPPPPVNPTPQFDYSDLWFNPSESGWGFNAIQHASNNIFGVIYTYEAPNRPAWYVLPGGTWTAETIFTGLLYHVTGSPYNVTPFKPGDVRQVGTATLRFTDRDHASFTYSVDGVQVTKLIERQSF